MTDYEPLLKRLTELREAANPGPWKRKGSGIYSIDGVRIFHWLEVSNAGLQPIENAALAAPAHEYAAVAEALVAAVPKLAYHVPRCSRKDCAGCKGLIALDALAKALAHG